jgi:hypothetical protein
MAGSRRATGISVPAHACVVTKQGVGDLPPSHGEIVHPPPREKITTIFVNIALRHDRRPMPPPRWWPKTTTSPYGRDETGAQAIRMSEMPRHHRGRCL